MKKKDSERVPFVGVLLNKCNIVYSSRMEKWERQSLQD